MKGKFYADSEDAIRFGIFIKTNDFIEKHNKEFQEGKHTYTVGHNQFSDMTDEEKAKYRGFRV